MSKLENQADTSYPPEDLLGPFRLGKEPSESKQPKTATVEENTAADPDDQPGGKPASDGSNGDAEPEPEIDATQANKEPDPLDAPEMRARIAQYGQRRIFGRKRTVYDGRDLLEFDRQLRERKQRHRNWGRLLKKLDVPYETATDYMWYAEAYDHAKKLGKIPRFLNLRRTDVYPLGGRSDRLGALEALLNEAEGGTSSSQPETAPVEPEEGVGDDAEDSAGDSESDHDNTGPESMPKPEPKSRERRLTLFKSDIKRVYCAYQEPQNRDLRAEVFRWAWNEYPDLWWALVDAKPDDVDRPQT